MTGEARRVQDRVRLRRSSSGSEADEIWHLRSGKRDRTIADAAEWDDD